MTFPFSQPATGLRVLIVDDEVAVCEAASEYLSAYGFRVDTAHELTEAQAMLAASSYALLIADVRLTGVQDREGIELVRFARRRAPGTRIIVMTAHACPDLEREAREGGADLFLEKPMPLSDLLFRARRLLDDRGGLADPAS